MERVDVRMGISLALVSLVIGCARQATPAPTPVAHAEAEAPIPTMPRSSPGCVLRSMPSVRAPTLTWETVVPSTVSVADAQATIALHRPHLPGDPEALLATAAAYMDVYRSTQDQAALESGIQTYARLVHDFPNHETMDEVLWKLGWGLQQLRQFERARMVWHRLVQHHPGSPRVLMAYVEFGVYYLGEDDPLAASRFFLRARELGDSPQFATRADLEDEVAQEVEAALAYAGYAEVWSNFLANGSVEDPTPALDALRLELTSQPATHASTQVLEAINREWCSR